MSKYDKLWEHIKEENKDLLLLSFDDVYTITELPIDHSFLNVKKELINYGYEVDKISLKNKTILIKRIIQ